MDALGLERGHNGERLTQGKHAGVKRCGEDSKNARPFRGKPGMNKVHVPVFFFFFGICDLYSRATPPPSLSASADLMLPTKTTPLSLAPCERDLYIAGALL